MAYIDTIQKDGTTYDIQDKRVSSDHSYYVDNLFDKIILEFARIDNASDVHIFYFYLSKDATDIVIQQVNNSFSALLPMTLTRSNFTTIITQLAQSSSLTSDYKLMLFKLLYNWSLNVRYWIELDGFMSSIIEYDSTNGIMVRTQSINPFDQTSYTVTKWELTYYTD